MAVPFYTIPNSSKFGSLNKSSPCVVCCGRSSVLNIRHAHLSTQHYHKASAQLGDMSPWCYHCNSSHKMDQMTRTKVYLTTSTLYGVHFLGGWPGLPVHCDWEAVSGGQLDTLRKAWERAYGSHIHPVDTILVGGLNDVRPIVSSLQDSRAPKGSQPGKECVASMAKDEFILRVRKIWTVMTDHGKSQNTDNTLAVSRLMLVPALYWHEDDGELPDPYYTNYKDVVEAINQGISEFNTEVGSPHTPNLQSTGRRGLGKGARSGYIFSRYREQDKSNMMHFADKFRIIIAMRLYKYFETRTPNAINYLE